MGRYIKKPPKQIRCDHKGKGAPVRILYEDELWAQLCKIAPMETITVGSMSIKTMPFNEEILEKMKQLGLVKILKRRSP
jgi:hypothetical protein